ncbi:MULTISPECIES: hypothetical protein [Flavobacterium]|uniref:hypothetical protein n=1 Tax=Flavobacterium TaxID=237 RepID=UPI0009666F92|nr:MULTISPECIES: hypothetical protein [Flavobacterium]MBN9282863.1 hypothetical protein [Flavobacterium sp.]OJV67506.1 MAG: hypothetical protein BGO42_15830 [Flavobacterium sp. 40-81]
MKKILLLLTVVAAFAFQGCEGPEGPQGPQGPSDGNTISEVFEVTRSFNAGNNFGSIVPLNPQIYASDVVLVYLLWDTVNPTTPIWRLMPQTVQLSEGDLLYNFDFTRSDVNIFLSSADLDLNMLAPQWTQNQTFRIVIVPGYFSKNAQPVDYSDYNAVIKAYNIDESKIKVLK